MMMTDGKKMAMAILSSRSRNTDRAAELRGETESNLKGMADEERDLGSEADTAQGLAGEALCKALSSNDGAKVAKAFMTLYRLCEISDDEDY